MSVLRIAHRAGNDLRLIPPALALGADIIEADVYASRGRLEVRHARRLGPLPYLWEPWYLLPDAAPLLADLRAATPAGTLLMLDLKGGGAALGTQVQQAMEGAGPYVVCGRSWSVLRAFDGDPQVRVVHSAGSRGEVRRLAPYVRVHATWGVSVHKDLLSAARVSRLRDHVEVLMTWPIDTPADYDRVVALGADAVISNDLAALPGG